MTFHRTHGTTDARQAAEAVFRPITKAVQSAQELQKPAIPDSKELVSLRLDRDVLERFRKEGLGWRERINAALRRAAVDL